MKKIYALISFLVCALSAGSCADYQLIGMEVLSEELVAQHYTINPNLDAVIVVDRTTPIFEYQTFYCAGWADEEEGKQGRLHFLEHIMSSTGSQEYGKLNRIVSKNGGQKNATTYHHFTRFTLRFPKDKFDLAVEIDSDRFYNTVINEEVIAKERKIILTERNRMLANLTRRFTYYFFDLVYKKKNFDGFGTEAFIKQLNSVDLRAYYENFLRQQKRLIVVIGDVDRDYVLMKLEEAYSSTCAMQPQARLLPYGQADRNEPVPSQLPAFQFPNSEILGKKFKITSKNLSISKFRKSWNTPNLGHQDYVGLFIIANILNKTANSLRSYAVDSGLARVFHIELNYYKGFGLMSCTADLPHTTSPDAIHDIIQVELEKLKSISEDDLNAARNELLHRLYSTFYEHSSMAYSFGKAFAHANDPLLYLKLINDIESIHRADISRIINQYLTDDNSITVYLTLKKPKE